MPEIAKDKVSGRDPRVEGEVWHGRYGDLCGEVTVGSVYTFATLVSILKTSTGTFIKTLQRFHVVLFTIQIKNNGLTLFGTPRLFFFCPFFSFFFALPHAGWALTSHSQTVMKQQLAGKAPKR